MKKTIATSRLTITTDCPYCDEYLDLTDELAECLNDEDGFLRAKEIEHETECPRCHKHFIVEQIEY